MIHTCQNISLFFTLRQHWLNIPAPTQSKATSTPPTYMVKGRCPHFTWALNTYTIRNSQNILTHTIVLLYHSLVSFRDNGTGQMKFPDVIHNTQYVPQPSFTEGIPPKKTPCGNRPSPKAKHESKQSCPLTQNNHSSGKEYGNTRSGKGEKEAEHIHPTMRNIVRSKLFPVAV